MRGYGQGTISGNKLVSVNRYSRRWAANKVRRPQEGFEGIFCLEKFHAVFLSWMHVMLGKVLWCGSDISESKSGLGRLSDSIEKVGSLFTRRRDYLNGRLNEGLEEVYGIRGLIRKPKRLAMRLAPLYGKIYVMCYQNRKYLVVAWLCRFWSGHNCIVMVMVLCVFDASKGFQEQE